MAEFEPGIRKLLTQQQNELQRIIIRSSIANEGIFDPKSGCFNALERRPEEHPAGFLPYTMFYQNLIGEQSDQYRLEIQNNRIRLYNTVGKRNNYNIPTERVRVIDKLYSGEYSVGETGWVLLNVLDPLTKGKLMTETDALCILLHPDYRGIKKVQVIVFDPLIRLINTGLRQIKLLPDAVVLNDEGRFIPKKVIRILSKIF